MVKGRRNRIDFPIFIRYGMVGVLGTGLHFASLILLVEKIHFDPVIASVLGFILVLVVSYFLNCFWTFRSKNRGIREFLAYVIVSLTGLALNSTIMYFSVHIWHWNYLYGQSLVIAIVPISNYFLNRLWTFRAIDQKKD